MTHQPTKTSTKINLSFRELYLVIKTYDASGGISTNKTHGTIILGLIRALINDQLEKKVIEDVLEVDARHLIIERAREVALDLGDPKIEHLNSLRMVESEVQGGQAARIAAKVEAAQSKEAIEDLDLFSPVLGSDTQEED